LEEIKKEIHFGGKMQNIATHIAHLILHMITLRVKIIIAISTPNWVDGGEHMMPLSVCNKVSGRRMMFCKKLMLYIKIKIFIISKKI
jgi:hypothetical protein